MHLFLNWISAFGGGTFFGTLIGIYLGHRLQLGRDKRAEWNALIDPIRERLVSTASDLRGGQWYITPIELDRIDKYFDPISRVRLREAMTAHQKCCAEQIRTDSAGQRYFVDVRAVTATTEAALDLIRRR